MSLEITVNGYVWPVKAFSFSDGTQYVSLRKDIPKGSLVGIKAYIKSSDDIMRLFSLLQICNDAKAEVNLFLPYVPYARMDRKMGKGQANQLKMFCKLLNNYKCSSVYIDDPHSDVCEALIDNVIVKSQAEILRNEYKARFDWINNCDAIIAPDAGAAKKAFKVAQLYGKPLIQCGKQRDSNGKIVKSEVYGDISGKKCVIVDDILDAGGTFIKLAEQMGDAKELNLVVTHGIFAKGKECFSPYFDRVEAIYDWTNGDL